MRQKRNTFEQYLAEHLLRHYPQAGSHVYDFLVYLVAAARQGHLCVELENAKLNPAPQQLWREQCILEDASNDYQPIEAHIHQGMRQIPSELVTELEPSALLLRTPIGRAGKRYYLHRNWIAETAFLSYLERINKTTPNLMPDIALVRSRVEDLVTAGMLQPEQGEAILCACGHTVTLISGGPGTGKTYTAGQFVRLFLAGLSEADRTACQIAVAAPTGKAAAQLEASLAPYADGAIRAQTLHALLQIRPDREMEEIRPHPADLFLIDEASMIDLRMMANLFAALKPGARVVILGDHNQLPSIEAGHVFADLVRSGKCACVQLRRSLRTDCERILQLSAAIKAGDEIQTLAQLALQSLETSLIREAAKYYLIDQDDPEQILKQFQKFRLLSPLRKGPWGVEEVNRVLYQHCRQHSSTDRFFVPIMITRNDPSIGLFNGEVGVLMNGESAFFSSHQSVKKIPAALLPQYEYAYCMSVHKSQGSEFDDVWLLLPEGAEVFGRELLYTAVTRAKKQIQAWGTEAVVRAIVSQKSERLSGIIPK